MEPAPTFETAQHFCADEAYVEKLTASYTEFGWTFNGAQQNRLGMMASFTRRKLPLLEAELTALGQLLSGVDGEPIDDLTYGSLIESRLAGEDGTITKFGIAAFVETRDLKTQCALLNIPLQIIAVPKESKTEIDALNYFRRAGFDGTFCEAGAILTLIKSLCLDWFGCTRPASDKMDAFSQDELRARASSAYLESLLTEHHQQEEAISAAMVSAKNEQLLSNFKEIYRNEIVQKSYPGLNAEIMQVLYSAIGEALLVRILRFLMKDPFLFRKGWPDLTLVRDGQISLVEVKVRDKLHFSQVVTIPEIRNRLGLNVSVVVVDRGSQKGQAPS